MRLYWHLNQRTWESKTWDENNTIGKKSNLGSVTCTALTIEKIKKTA